MTGLADVDRFKICIGDCVRPGFRPLDTKIIYIDQEMNMKAIDLMFCVCYF